MERDHIDVEQSGKDVGHASEAFTQMGILRPCRPQSMQNDLKARPSVSTFIDIYVAIRTDMSVNLIRPHVERCRGTGIALTLVVLHGRHPADNRFPAQDK